MFETHGTPLLDITEYSKEALAKQQVRAEELIIFDAIKLRIGQFCTDDIEGRLSKIVPVGGKGVEHYLLDGKNLVSFGPYQIEHHCDGKGYRCSISRSVKTYGATNSPNQDKG